MGARSASGDADDDTASVRIPVRGTEPGQGRLWRIDADGTATCMDKGFHISNGLGWSPDNSVFYFTRIGLANGSLKATVTPIGYTDPNPGDDSDSIPIY